MTEQELINTREDKSLSIMTKHINGSTIYIVVRGTSDEAVKRAMEYVWRSITQEGDTPYTDATIKTLADALEKAVKRQGFSNEELLDARDILKKVRRNV